MRPKWPGARREEGASPQRAVTDEQQSPRPFSAPPSGPQFFSPPALWLAPFRPLRVCASLAPSERRKPLAAKLQPIERHHTSGIIILLIRSILSENRVRNARVGISNFKAAAAFCYNFRRDKEGKRISFYPQITPPSWSALFSCRKRPQGDQRGRNSI